MRSGFAGSCRLVPARHAREGQKREDAQGSDSANRLVAKPANGMLTPSAITIAGTLSGGAIMPSVPISAI